MNQRRVAANLATPEDDRMPHTESAYIRPMMAARPNRPTRLIRKASEISWDRQKLSVSEGGGRQTACLVIGYYCFTQVTACAGRGNPAQYT
jgi:hypothetical protein